MNGGRWALLAAIHLAFSITASAAGEVKHGRVDVGNADFKQVFQSGEKVYPGEKLKLEYHFGLDVMRHMHRDRECWSKWFGGIDCKYVEHLDGSDVGEDQAPALFRLETADTDPKAASDGYDPALHIAPKPISLDVVYPGEVETFKLGASLTARVGVNWGVNGANGPLNRTSCRDFVDGGTCSQGEYDVTLIGWDVSVREAKLNEYLAKPRTAADLAINGDVLDYFLVNDVDEGHQVKRRKGLAASVLAHVKAQYPTVGTEPPQEQRDILAIAAELDPASPEIQAAVVQNRIDAGQLADARDANQRSLTDLKRSYESGDRAPATLAAYGETLRQGGSIISKEYVGSDADTVKVAARFYESAARIWGEYNQIDSADAARGRAGIVGALVDEARALRMIGGRGNIAQAVKALRAARSELPREGEGLVDDVGGGGIMLATDDLSKVAYGKVPVSVSFVPEGLVNATDVDPATSSVLYRKGKTYRRLEGHSMEAAVVLDGDEPKLVSAVLHANGVAGMDDEGHLYLVDADGTSELQGALGASALWTIARVADLTAFANHDRAKVCFLEKGKQRACWAGSAGTVAGLALSRDGKRLAVVIDDHGARTLSVVELDASPYPAATVSINNLPSAGRLQLLFSNDGSQVLVTCAGKWSLLKGDDLRSGEDATTSSYAPVGDGRFIAPVVTERQAVIGLSMIAQRPVPAKPNAPPPAALALRPVQERITFATELPADSFVLLGAGGGDTILAGAASMPATLRVYDAGGSILGAKPMHAWRPGIAKIAGGFVLANTVGGACAKAAAIKDPGTLDCDTKSGSTMSEQNYLPGKDEVAVELVPLALAGGGYALVGYDVGGSPSSVALFDGLGPDATSITLLPRVSAGANMHWKFVRTSSGPLNAGATDLAFLGWPAKTTDATSSLTLSREDDNQAFAELERIDATIFSFGPQGVKEAHVKVRDPEAVAAIIDGLVVEKRQTGFATVRDGAPNDYLDAKDAAATAGGEERIYVDGPHVLLAQRDGASLRLTGFLAKGGVLLRQWDDKIEAQADVGSLEGLNEIYPPAMHFPGFATAFAHSEGGTAPDVLVSAKDRVVIVGGAAVPVKTPPFPFGAPVLIDEGTAIVQGRDHKFQIWKLGPRT